MNLYMPWFISDTQQVFIKIPESDITEIVESFKHVCIRKGFAEVFHTHVDMTYVKITDSMK